MRWSSAFLQTHLQEKAHSFYAVLFVQCAQSVSFILNLQTGSTSFEQLPFKSSDCDLLTQIEFCWFQPASQWVSLPYHNKFQFCQSETENICQGTWFGF